MCCVEIPFSGGAGRGPVGRYRLVGEVGVRHRGLIHERGHICAATLVTVRVAVVAAVAIVTLNTAVTVVVVSIVLVDIMMAVTGTATGAVTGALVVIVVVLVRMWLLEKFSWNTTSMPYLNVPIKFPGGLIAIVVGICRTCEKVS